MLACWALAATAAAQTGTAEASGSEAATAPAPASDASAPVEPPAVPPAEAAVGAQAAGASEPGAATVTSETPAATPEDSALPRSAPAPVPVTPAKPVNAAVVVPAVQPAPAAVDASGSSGDYRPEREVHDPHRPEEPDASYPRFEFGARLMFGYELKQRHPEPSQNLSGKPATEHGFFLEQARVKVRAWLTKRIRATISADIGSDPLRSAFINFKVKRAFQIKAGRFKRPFSRLELRSIAELPFRDRGIFNDKIIEDGNWGDRSLGVMLWGKLRGPRLRWSAAAMHPVSDLGSFNIKQGIDAMGRLQWDPVHAFSIAVNGGHKVLDDEFSETLHLNAIGGDVRIRGGGLYAILEADLAQHRNPPTPPVPADRQVTATPYAVGLMGMVTYDIQFSQVFTLQPMLTGEFVDTDLELSQDETLRAQFGLNFLLYDLIRVMPQVEIERPIGVVSARSRMASETYYLLLSGQFGEP